MTDIDEISPWPGPPASVLLRRSRLPVPLLGAGISASTGLPLGRELAAWIEAHELADGVDFAPVGRMRASPLHVSSHLIDRRPDISEPLRTAVREHFDALSRGATLTPTLLHLARIPGRLIVTLNYDDLIERAAEEQGIPVVSVTRRGVARLIGDGLPRPQDPLHVVHLHGSVRHPDPLVIDADAYSEPMGDDNVAALVSAVLADRMFCLLGTSFDELYLRTIFRRFRGRRARHVIVCSDDDADRIRANDPGAPISHLDRIEPCSYAPGRHDVVEGFCAALVAPLADATASGVLVAPDDLPHDPQYVGRRLLRTDQDEDPQVALMLGRAEVLDERGLGEQARAVVVGAPGAGKTELLRRLAAEPLAGERVALVPLRNVREWTGTPQALLADWLGVADPTFGTIDPGQAVEGGVRVHLLLDSLDEPAPSLRRAAADAIARVGEAFPDVRVTLTSRPIAALDALSADWPRYELLCDEAWRERFLESKGTTGAAFAERLDSARAALEPLLTVPFFLRRLAELDDDDLGRAIAAGDALGVVLSLLDRSIDEDPGLARVASGVRSWLTEVALWMQLTGRRSLELGELEPIAARLGLGDAALLTDQLVGRSLLDEGAERWSFGHRLFADALAAHHLREADPAAWIDVIAPVALGRSAVREDWRATFALLGPVSLRWRGCVAARDPIAAARTTPAAAPSEERRQAVATLWNRASELGVWLDGGMAGESDDAAMIATLLRPGDIEVELARFERALGSESRYDRMNALDVLLLSTPTRGEELLADVLAGEPDSTLRRNAASWVRRLELTSLAGAVLARAVEPEDESEASDMTSVVLDLTAPEDRLGVGRRIFDAGNTEVRDYHHLFAEADPLEYVRWLRDRAPTEPPESLPSLENALIDRLEPLDGVADAGAADVGEALALVRSAKPAALTWLGAHPASANGIVRAIRDHELRAYEITRILLAVGSDALAAAGCGEEILEALRRWEYARDHPAPIEPGEPEPTPEPDGPEEGPLAQVLALPGDERLVTLARRHHALAREAQAAPAAVQAQLREVLDELWAQRELRASVTPTDGGATVQYWASVVLTYGPASSLELSDERWTDTATCGWLFTEQFAWLDGQANQERLDNAAVAAPADARQLADLLTIARRAQLSVERVVPRLAELTSPLGDRTGARLARALADAEHPDALRRLRDGHPEITEAAGPLLAAAGDVDAQREELTGLRDAFRAGTSVDRHDTPWMDRVRDPALAALLVDVIVAGKQREGDDPRFDAVENAVAALEAIGGSAALQAFDRLIAERPWSGAQWLYVNRDRILQRELDAEALGPSETRLREL